MKTLEVIKSLTKFEKCLWVCSALIILISYAAMGQVQILTLAAPLVGVTALIFIAKGDVRGQVLTVVFSILYGIISFQARYYGEMITYLAMTGPIAVVSIITWLRNPYGENEVKVNKIAGKSVILLVGITAAVTVIFFFVLRYFHTASLVVSTISIATSFLASSLTVLRSPYYAVAYGMNDIVLITLWIIASVNNITCLPMVACFFAFLLNDIYGFISWEKMRIRQSDVQELQIER